MDARKRWLPMLQDPDPQERVLALEGFTDEAADEAHDAVVGALEDDAPLVRAAAARLADRVTPSVPTKQVGGLLRDEAEPVRLRVVTALAERGTEEALSLLEARLSEESSEKVLASLILTLGQKAGPEVLSRLAPFLQHADDRVRANTVEAIDLLLQRAYNRWMVPLGEDSNNRVRANAVVALGRFNQAAAATAMESLVGHEEKWFRMSAAWAAGASGMPRVVETVLPLLHDEDPEIRIQTLRSLALHRQLPTRLALQEWLEKEDDPAVLQYAGEILRPGE